MYPDEYLILTVTSTENLSLSYDSTIALHVSYLNFIAALLSKSSALQTTVLKIQKQQKVTFASVKVSQLEKKNYLKQYA